MWLVEVNFVNQRRNRKFRSLSKKKFAGLTFAGQRQNRKFRNLAKKGYN